MSINFVCMFILIIFSMKTNALDKPHFIPIENHANYVDSGEFLLAQSGANIHASLDKIRHAYYPEQKRERIVFILENKDIPGIFAHFSGKILSIDFHQTELSDSFQSLGLAHNIEKIRIFEMNKELLTLEIHFKEITKIELFYLIGPQARIVLDIKEN